MSTTLLTVPTSEARTTNSDLTRPLVGVWVAVSLSAVGGLAMDLATPEVSWWPLAFVSVILTLVATVGRSVGGALLVGLAFGVTFYALHLDWVGQFLGPLPRIALSGLQALLFGLGAVPLALAYRWTSRFRGRRVWQIVAVPALVGGLWVAREIVLGSWPYGGFPWVRLGMTQVESPFPEATSWIGVTGLSLTISVIAASIVQWLRIGLRAVSVLTPAVVLIFGLSVTPQYATTDAGTFAVGWVQGNGPSGYFDGRASGDLLKAQVAASEPILDRNMDVLVWPEGSAEFDPFRNRQAASELNRIVSRTGAPLLANAATARGDETFNTSFLWTANPGSSQVHDKVNPVPFGEYVPDRWMYERLAPDLVGLIQREYTAGTNPPVVTVGETVIGLAICFDVIFDDVIRAAAEQDVKLYIFQTNNADFRGSDENLQQLAFARMRAIQTGKSVVNVSTVGTSQVIAPDGAILDTAGVDTVAAAITDVPLRSGIAPGILAEKWLALSAPLLAFGSLATLALIVRRASSNGPDPTPEPDSGGPNRDHT